MAHTARARKYGLTQKQVDFIEWLCTPPAIREPKTQVEYARSVHCHHKTLAAWKRDLDFKRAWDHRLTELQVDPENLEAVMAALFSKALKEDTKAISMWMDVYRQFRPPPEPEVEEVTVLSDLSDDDLQALIAGEVAAEREKRAVAQISSVSPLEGVLRGADA